MKLTVNWEALKSAMQKGKLILISGILALELAGCLPTEVSTNANVQYDVIDTMNQDIVNSGIQQIIDVPGEDFQLVVNYRCILPDNARWTITSDKDMYMDICTSGLEQNTKVYIDNVHIDTTILSYFPSVDGITQDTMDDRIHNGQMIGFPISDSNIYSNINSIEGQNQTFMQGSFYGFSGYSSGSISQKRYVESDYLSRGVYANKIKSIVDLVIVKTDGTTSCVSVPSTVVVSVWPYIELTNNGESTYRYYYFDPDSHTLKTKDLNATEYSRAIEKGKQYHK